MGLDPLIYKEKKNVREWIETFSSYRNRFKKNCDKKNTPPLPCFHCTVNVYMTHFIYSNISLYNRDSSC